MTVDWSRLYASRARGLRRSDIREALRVGDQEAVISLAGGLPAPELFPAEAFRQSFDRLLRDAPASLLQYGRTEGHPPLREFLAERLGRQGIACDPREVLITNGSQQALDLIGRLLLEPGDEVVVENPSYPGALECLRQYQVRLLPVPTDDEGMRVDLLEEALSGRGGAGRVKLAYVVPSFQNPTGRTMSLRRRHALLAVADHYGIPLVEDDAYGELRYQGEPLPSLRSLDRSDTVLYVGTFSKTLSPGLRLGYAVAQPPVAEALLHLKERSDLHTSTTVQVAALEVADDGFLDRHVGRLVASYRERCQAMLDAIAAHLPSGIGNTRPRGGFFVWLTLPPPLDARALLSDALASKVLFVPGQGFHPDGSGVGTLRLSFSGNQPEMLREAVRRLGTVLSRRLEQPGRPDTPVGAPGAG